MTGDVTDEELVAAFKRLEPYLNGYPQPMIDARRLRIANGSASEQDRREIAAENVVVKRLKTQGLIPLTVWNEADGVGFEMLGGGGSGGSQIIA